MYGGPGFHAQQDAGLSCSYLATRRTMFAN